MYACAMFSRRAKWRVVGVDAGLVDVQGDRDTLRCEPSRQQHRIHDDHRGDDHDDGDQLRPAGKQHQRYGKYQANDHRAAEDPLQLAVRPHQGHRSAKHGTALYVSASVVSRVC